MRATLITGGLLVAVGAIAVLPALSARTPREARATPGESSAKPETAGAPRDVARRRPAFPESLEAAAGAARAGRWEQALVHAATAPAGTQRSLALRETVAAHALARVGEHEQAEQAARRVIEAAEHEPMLRARAAFLVGEALEARGRSAEAAASFAMAQEGSPALAAEARRRHAAALAASDPGRAAEALGLVAPPAEVPASTAEDLALAAELATAAGDPRALGWLRRLHYEHPASHEARAAASHPLLAHEAETALREGRHEQVLARADALLEADLDALAARDIEAAARVGVPAASRAALELHQGRLLRLRKQHQRALAHLEKAAASGDATGCRAAFLGSRSARALRRTGDAARLLKRAATGCACEHRDRAALELASSASEDGHADAARTHWARVRDEGVTPAAREQAGWRLAWSDWTAGRRDRAAAGFEALVAAAPESRQAAAARYWQARLAREAGNLESSRSMLLALASDFPREWYGVLAADEAGLELPSPPSCAGADAREDLAVAAFAAMPVASEAAGLLDLDDLGLVDEALAEIDASVAEPAARAGLRALVLSRAGRSREALRDFRRAVPDWRRRVDVPAGLACAAWPLQHEELILRSSLALSLEPALVFGLVHQESVFDERAISHAGARGLMQVMPATGQVIAKWLGERVTTPRLLEPELNVRYGTTYLRRLLDESGRVEVALAGYNAGPGRARRWWAASGDDLALFVENIPFDETRDYVKAIAVNERLYRARLAERTAGAGQ